MIDPRATMAFEIQKINPAPFQNKETKPKQNKNSNKYVSLA